LEEYIENFPGAVIVVSHDRYFLDKITDKLLIFEGQGSVNEFFGTSDEYFERVEKEKTQRKTKKKSIHKDQPKKKEEKTKTKLNYMEEKEWATIEEEIM